MDEFENRPGNGLKPMSSVYDRADDLDVWKLLGVVHRRFKLVATVILSMIAVAVVVVTGITPRYSSEARILIENSESSFARPQGATATTLAADQAAVLSQVQVMLSRDLAAEVSAGTGLAEVDEFSGQGRKKPLYKRLLSLIGFSGKKVLPSDERVIDTYFKRLSVEQIETARVVSIRFSAENAELAATVANTLADTYIDATRQAKYSSDKDAAKWLKSEIDDLRGKVAEAEAAVEKFRAGKGLLQSGRDMSLNQQQLGQINTQLITAKVQVSEARARAALVGRLLKQPGGIDAAAEVLNSRLIQRLRELQAGQSRSFAELSAALLPGHPRMRQLRAEQKDIERRIRSEIKKIARGLENEAKVADARVREMGENLNSFKIEAVNAKTAEVELRALERESKAQRDLLESFLSRYREASARGNLDSQPANARIISRASAASRPSYPAKGPILALSSVAAVLFSLVIAFLVEFLSPKGAARPGSAVGAMAGGRGFDAEAMPSLAGIKSAGIPAGGDGVPVTGGISSPFISERQSRETSLFGGQFDTASLVQVSGNIARMTVARNYRRLAVLDLVDTRRGAEIVGEIVNALGQSGRSAVLVEAGEARYLTEIEHLGTGPGLVDLLTGSAGLGDVITRRGQEHVAFIAGGARVLPDSVAPDRLQQVIEVLGARFEVVVVLAGAPSAKTLQLAAASDLTLLVARPEAVAKPGFKASIEALSGAGVSEAVVITVGAQAVGHYEAISPRGDMPHVA